MIFNQIKWQNHVSNILSSIAGVMTAIKSMHSLANLENVDILDYIEHTVFIIKKSSNLPKNSLF